MYQPEPAILWYRIGSMRSKRGARLFALLAPLICGLVRGGPAAAGEECPDSLRERSSSFVALPYVYYTPETKLAFGGGSVYSFRFAGAPSAERPSNVRVALTYTQLHQVILAAKPEVYLLRERWFFSGYYGFYRYPDRFWGIGGDTPDEAEEEYESNDFESYTNAQKRVLPGLYAGVRQEYRYLSIGETSPGGMLSSGTLPGSRGGAVSGLGVIASYDTRDHVYQPSTGFFNQCYAVFFGSDLGGDFTFEVLSVDLRWYRRVFGSHVVAFQTFDTFVTGEPPFQMLSLIGGSYAMRGYHLGRYRDRHMLTAQAEYRFPVRWRFGGVVFAGAGDVAPTLDGFRLDRVKYGFGCGVRFLFDTRERIHARLDAGFGRDGSAGVYAMVLEAF